MRRSGGGGDGDRVLAHTRGGSFNKPEGGGRGAVKTMQNLGAKEGAYLWPRRKWAATKAPGFNVCARMKAMTCGGERCWLSNKNSASVKVCVHVCVCVCGCVRMYIILESLIWREQLSEEHAVQVSPVKFYDSTSHRQKKHHATYTRV